MSHIKNAGPPAEPTADPDRRSVGEPIDAARAGDALAAGLVAAELRTAQRPPEPRRLRWWFEDPNGQLVLGQRPNVWAIAATGLSTASCLPLPDALSGGRTVLRRLGRAAMVGWGLDEALRGTTPARRVTGALAVVAQAAHAAEQLRARGPKRRSVA